MKIRQATVADTDGIIAMLQRYKQASPLEFHKKSTEETARHILDVIFSKNYGVVLVAEDPAHELQGMLIAIKNVNIWDKNLYCLNELAYWVNPEARNTSAGYRLLKSYQDIAEFMKRGGEIAYYTISKMVTSPDLNYERFGFKKLEEMWSN
jgi:N-acetylglutamate synthase-like GNAT family acetyltransferase